MLRSSYIVEMLQNRIITMHANPTVMKYLNMGYKTVSWMINSFWENIYMYTYQKNSIQENPPCDFKTLNTNMQNKAWWNKIQGTITTIICSFSNLKEMINQKFFNEMKIPLKIYFWDENWVEMDYWFWRCRNRQTEE